jgi:hypothetical protein
MNNKRKRKKNSEISIKRPNHAPQGLRKNKNKPNPNSVDGQKEIFQVCG